MLAKIFYSICTILALSASATARIGDCAGQGSFLVSDVVRSNGYLTVGPKSVHQFSEGSAQLCVANRSPTDTVTLTPSQVNDAVTQILFHCCLGETICIGGGSKNVAADSGDTVDFALQANGQNCTP